MDPKDLLYQLFPLMARLAADSSFPDRPVNAEDINWVLRLINNGAIRKANGEAFPAGMSYEEITRQMMHEAKHSENMAELPEGKKKSTQMLLVEIDGGYKPVAIDFTFDAKMKCEGVSEAQPIPGKMAAAPQTNSRIFTDVYNMANDLWNELDENEPLFFKGSEQYFNMKNALTEFIDKFGDNVQPFEQEASLVDLMTMFKPIIHSADAYVNAKLDGKELDSRQFDRLRICKTLQSLGKRITEASEAETDLEKAKGNEAKTVAKNKLKAVQNGLRSYELMKDKVANDMIFGTMKSKGLKFAYDVLNKQRAAEGSLYSTVGLYDDMFSKLKKSDDFKAVIDETAQAGALPYGQNITTLNKLSQKKPDYLAEKLTERRQKAAKDAEFQSNAINRQPKSEDEIKEILENVKKIGNPVLYTVCQTTLNLTNRMVKDLSAADGTSIHSNAFKRFRSELKGIHERLLISIGADANSKKDGQEKILKGMCNEFKNLVAAAHDYQTEHMDKTYETAGVKITNRLKVATGVQVLNDFLTNEDNQQLILNKNESVIDKMGQDIATFRNVCGNTENLGIETLLNYDSAYKSSVGPIASNNEFLRHDEWGQCFGMTQTVAERKAAEKELLQRRLDTLQQKYKASFTKEAKYEKNKKHLIKLYNEAPEEIAAFKENWQKTLEKNNGQASKDDIKNAHQMLVRNLQGEYGILDVCAVEIGGLASLVREQIKAYPEEEFKSFDNDLSRLEGNAKKASERLKKFPKISKEDSWIFSKNTYEFAGFDPETAEPVKKPEVAQNAEPKPDSKAYKELYEKKSSVEDLYLK